MLTLRVTQEVGAVRHWVDGRGGWPCRRLDGGLAVGFGGDICRGVRIGWDEFEVNFCAGHLALAYDEAAGSIRCFIGKLPDARSFAAEAVAPAVPPGTGAVGPPQAAPPERGRATPG